MSKEVKYFCDCCGKEIGEHSYSFKYCIDEAVYGGTDENRYPVKYESPDLCDSCAEEIDNAIDAVLASHVITSEI